MNTIFPDKSAPLYGRKTGWLLLSLALMLVWILLSASGALAASREVRVGLYNNPPKIMPSANGVPTGILGDLLQEIARQENWTLQPVHCTWEACLSALESGDIDLLPDVAYNEKRALVLDFHQTAALQAWSQIYRREDVKIQSMLDLQNKRLAVLAGSVQEQYLQDLLAGFSIQATFIPVQSFEQAFTKVAAHEADAAATNYHFGDQEAGRFKLLPTSLIFLPAKIYYATGKGRNPDLLQAIDRNLNLWHANPQSFYFQNLKHWSGLPSSPTIPTAFWWGLTIVAALFLLAVAGMLLLRREVARQTHNLRASEERLSTILNSVEAHVFIKDPQLRYQYANRGLCEFLNLPIEQILGKTDDAFFDAATAARIQETDFSVLKSGQRLVKEEFGHKLGEPKKHVFLSVKLPLGLPGQEGYALCGISTDITEQRQFIEEIHQLAFYDPLTHLPNRKQLMERLQHCLAAPSHNQQSTHALLLINLDNFKDLNDTHGHSAGDQLLQQVAQRLTACARPGDMVARLGSDEFALLMGEHKSQAASSQHQIEYAATHILQALAEAPYSIGNLEYRASAGIGITILDNRQTSVEAILKHADLALFQAKAQGRKKMRFFKPDMEVVVAARAALEADLRDGLAREQFLLYYQPQVDSQYRLLGVEALVRWQHPQRGLVAPGSFIGLAEASGLIEPLGLWILRCACRQIADWSKNSDTAQLQIAVNISAHQLHHPKFVEQVLGILQETGANPNRLELELTESQLVEDMEGAIGKMQTLKGVGVHLSLDDFGTGYSSLNHLKRLPLDQLKIDQSFVRDLLIDANDLSIVKAIVGMGHSLNLAVLAEGVETQEQRNMLEQLGCVLYQGYWFGRPMPVEQLLDWRAPAINSGV
ncbi:MAG: EAL domain-containing protein [Giesbergeria sp.]|uniref:EAL domain-containing protein n=1 Tax=Giesbergeria sp. TaxID=2818473 RepID=UPI00262D47D7|nr:EAL domain-containing protein [Giesbergeria sp.]MDD2608675.1 EAL domain-containing protein [Giesbergeria sp.]